MVLVNIRGCNGSGKSTIPHNLMGDPEMWVYEEEYEGKILRVATVFPSYGWVAIGHYFVKSGGLDTLKRNATIKFAVMKTLEKFPEYDIMMEGIIASTIRSTYTNLFKEVEKLYPDRQVIIFSLVPPMEVCLDRIKARNNGKPINYSYIDGKYKQIIRNVKGFKDDGFISIKVDTSKVIKDKMHTSFFKTIDKYRIRED